MLIYNENLTKLYIGSYSDSLHSKNIVRTGKAFAIIFDSFTKGQGGLYITGVNGRECVGDELTEALRVHNAVRERYGGDPIERNFYKTEKPAQRMYVLEVDRIEVYNPKRSDEGLIVVETRVPVDTSNLV